MIQDHAIPDNGHETVKRSFRYEVVESVDGPPAWRADDEFLFVNGYGRVYTITREQFERVFPPLPI